MKSWYEIYRERMNENYVNHVAMKYAPFIQRVAETDESNFAEIGCGAGTITRILREMQDRWSSHTLIDACPKMLSLAVENNASPNCTFICADVSRVAIGSQCDVIHSHGLLEHFKDSDIRQIVYRMGRKAPVQLHYVPSSLYEFASRGDERLLTPQQWKEILAGLGKIEVSTFNDGLDIILQITR